MARLGVVTQGQQSASRLRTCSRRYRRYLAISWLSTLPQASAAFVLPWWVSAKQRSKCWNDDDHIVILSYRDSANNTGA